MKCPCLAVFLLALTAAGAVGADATPYDYIFPSVLGGFRARMRVLELDGGKVEIKKAKALGKILDRAGKTPHDVRSCAKLGLWISKTLNRKLADEEGLHTSFGWAVGEIQRLAGASSEDARFWGESFSPSRSRERALRLVQSGEEVVAAAGETEDTTARLKRLKKACGKIRKAEKRLAKLGPRPERVATIVNPGFELGEGDVPDGWVNWGTEEDPVWETGENRCIRLGSSEPAYHGPLVQTIEHLVPGRMYNVSARARAENLVIYGVDPQTTWGANLSLYGHTKFRSDRGSAYQGTFEEKEIIFTFRAETESELLCLDIAGPGRQSSGHVWFDDVTLRDADFAPEPAEGEHVRLYLETGDIEAAGLSEAQLAGWVQDLDHVYWVYADLVGGTPYGGAKIDILSLRQYPGGWAIAGNPVLWQQRYVPGVLERYRTLDDWSFGITHELSHDFDLDYRWVYQAEVQANFKMVYALEKLGGSVSQRGVLYPDGRIKDFYEIVWNEARAAGQATSWGGWLYRLLCIKDEIGWEPFRLMYRSYPTGVGGSAARLERYFDELERHSGVDIRGTLIPADELAWVRDQLN